MPGGKGVKLPLIPFSELLDIPLKAAELGFQFSPLSSTVDHSLPTFLFYKEKQPTNPSDALPYF